VSAHGRSKALTPERVEREGTLMSRQVFPAAGIVRRTARAARALGFAALVLPAMSAWCADPGRGQQVYATHCATCHGETGRPVWPGTPDFKRTSVLLKPDAQLLSAIRKGRGAMPAYAGVIRDRDLPDLVAYLRTLN
jgi:cytochrome c6